MCVSPMPLLTLTIFRRGVGKRSAHLHPSPGLLGYSVGGTPGRTKLWYSKTQTQTTTSTLPEKKWVHSPPTRLLDHGFQGVGFLTLGKRGTFITAG